MSISHPFTPHSGVSHAHVTCMSRASHAQLTRTSCACRASHPHLMQVAEEELSSQLSAERRAVEDVRAQADAVRKQGAGRVRVTLNWYRLSLRLLEAPP